MCDKAVNTHPSTIKFVSECFMTRGMCNKAINVFFVFDSTDRYKTQEMCDRVVSRDSFLIVYCSGKYKTKTTALYADENTWVSKWVFLYIKILIILTLIKILMKMILIPLFLSDAWLVILNSKSAKHLKKKISGELMPVVSHPKKWWNFCMSEGDKKK